jgi:hypothetical protein
MRKRVQSPLRIVADAVVVGWMWNNSNRVVPSLIRAVGCSRCARPQLLEALRGVQLKYSSLVLFVDSVNCTYVDSSVQPADGRRQLTVALLEFRSVIMCELKEMAKDFRQFRTQWRLKLADEAMSNNSSELYFSDDESDGKTSPMLSETASRPLASTNPKILDVSTASVVRGDFVCNVEMSAAVLNSTEMIGDTRTTDTGRTSTTESLITDAAVSWLGFYGERFTLHAAADLLLLYARTSNFFVLHQYRPLQSTPVEVYARELGNAVPRSVIDAGLMDDSDVPTTVTIGTTPLNEGGEQNPANFCRHSKDNPTFLPDLKRKANDLCAPDDIVAKVSVKYQGDYVLSQLLQWCNGGVGQKPGLPDLLGCTLLPSMSDCWSSDLLKRSKLSADRKTSYGCKILTSAGTRGPKKFGKRLLATNPSCFTATLHPCSYHSDRQSSTF